MLTFNISVRHKPKKMKWTFRKEVKQFYLQLNMSWYKFRGKGSIIPIYDQFSLDVSFRLEGLNKQSYLWSSPSWYQFWLNKTEHLYQWTSLFYCQFWRKRVTTFICCQISIEERSWSFLYMVKSLYLRFLSKGININKKPHQNHQKWRLHVEVIPKTVLMTCHMNVKEDFIVICCGVKKILFSNLILEEDL